MEGKVRPCRENTTTSVNGGIINRSSRASVKRLNAGRGTVGRGADWRRCMRKKVKLRKHLANDDYHTLGLARRSPPFEAPRSPRGALCAARHCARASCTYRPGPTRLARSGSLRHHIDLAIGALIRSDSPSKFEFSRASASRGGARRTAAKTRSTSRKLDQRTEKRQRYAARSVE